MNGSEIKTFVEGLLDNDIIDNDIFTSLYNSEKDEIEGLRDWEFLKKVDETQSAGSGAKTLPTDFRSPLWLFIGSDTTPYPQVPFEQKYIFTSGARGWYLDMRAGTYYILGNSSGGVIRLFYLYQTPDLTLSDSPVWPSRYHKLLGYRIAEKAYALMQEQRGL